MQTINAHFKPIDYWKQNRCFSLEDVLDFARCLENIGFKVMPEWHVLGNSEDRPKPDQATMLQCEEYNLSAEHSALTDKTGWIAARMPVPLIAEMLAPELWGSWHFEFSGHYDPDLYCDDQLIEECFFINSSIDVSESRGYEYQPLIYLRIPSPQNQPIGNIIARSSLSGLAKYNELIRDMARSLRASCQLLSTVNNRKNLYLQGDIDINRSKLTADERNKLCDVLYHAAKAVNLEAASNKELEGFIHSLERCKELLAPLAEYAKRFTVHLIGHSHIDLAWKWRWGESVECMKGTLETQLDLMKRDKDFVFVESSPAVWKALDETYPELWEECRQAAERGQLEPIGGMWCEPDGQCLGPESWVRQILQGQKAAREYCGRESGSGFNIDAFGFNAALPKIYKDAGIDSFVTQKLRYNEYTIFPYIHFWWESDDGSRILGLHAYPDHYHQIDPDGIPAFARIFHLTDGVYNLPIMFGYGNHGGGPLQQMMDRVDRLKSLTVYPNLRYSSFGDYFERIRKEEADALRQLPVIKDELFLETHHKTYTVQGKVKEADRECERQLLAAEALASVAMENGLDYDGTMLQDPWQKQLFNQFHDILTGTSFPSVYQDVFDDYGKAFRQIDAARSFISSKLLGEGGTTYVFNPLPWVRSAVVKLPADPFSSESGVLVDSRGNSSPYQKTSDQAEIVFVAKQLPGLGFETYKIGHGKDCGASRLKSGADWAENEYLKVHFDGPKGVIRSLAIDGMEMDHAEIGRLDLLEDTMSRYYETWNMGLTGREFHPECTSFEKIEDGPVRVVFRARYSFGLWEKKKPYYSLILWHTPGTDYPTSFFTQDFILYSVSNRVECVLQADWWEDQMVLKVAAETPLQETRAFYNIPFGAIERPTKRETAWEKGRFEVPANLWADLEGEVSGLAILNRSRHGYDALGGRLRLTLLASPWGENRSSVSDPLADRGRHRIEYAFYPHRNDYKAAEMHKNAFEYEYPAVVLKGNDQPAVGLGKSFLEVNPADFIVAAVKPAEDGNGVIVRGFEPYGNEVHVEFGGQLAGRSSSRTDLLERDLPGERQATGPHQIMTVRFK